MPFHAGLGLDKSPGARSEIDNEIVSRNPSDGQELGRVPATDPGIVADRVAAAREVQEWWRRESIRDRLRLLRRWWSILAQDAEAWADRLVAEIGKPRPEAMAEVVATLDALRWLDRNGRRTLADQRLATGWQRVMGLGSVRLHWRPLGVVGVLGTWNYPLFLNAPVIAGALAAGNAVVWKPSEMAALSGRALQESLDRAGIRPDLVVDVQGGPAVGRSLIEAPIDLGVFTGGVENGRRVLESLGARGIPAIAELSGFDPAIILPGARLERIVPALTWAAFVSAGQTCVAVKRVYVVGEARAWADALAEHAQALRVGDPSRGSADVGPLISESARARFDSYIRSAVAAGAEVLAGGGPGAGPGWFYRPTVLWADEDAPAVEEALSGCFGPVVLVRGVADADAAVRAANAAPFGLAASIWGPDRRAARALARRLDSGVVTLNDAVRPTAHAAAPFGGVKASGFGRVHGAIGLRSFCQPQAIHSPPAIALRPQLYPYSDRLESLLAIYRAWFHGGR